MFRTIREFAKDYFDLLWAPVGSALLSIIFWATLLVSVYLFATYQIAIVIGWAFVIRRNWDHQETKTGENIGWDRQMQALLKLLGGENKRAKRKFLRSIWSLLRAIF